MSGTGEFLEGYLPYLLQKADHLLSTSLHQALMKAGMQVSEWRVLAVLYDHGPLSVSELAEVALLPQPTASHTCRRLEGAGLLRREEPEEDRRRKIHSLTDDGSELVTDFIEQAQTYEAEAMARDGIDRAELMHQLRLLIDGLDRGGDQENVGSSHQGK